jgi:hypothetical protein
MKAFISSVALTSLTSGVQAHIADISSTQHAGEHAWLALLLVPPLALLLPLVRGRR